MLQFVLISKEHYGEFVDIEINGIFDNCVDMIEVARKRYPDHIKICIDGEERDELSYSGGLWSNLSTLETTVEEIKSAYKRYKHTMSDEDSDYLAKLLTDSRQKDDIKKQKQQEENDKKEYEKYLELRDKYEKVM